MAEKQGTGVIGMKSLGGGRRRRRKIVVGKVCTAEEARRFALSQPIASLVVGIDSMEVLEAGRRRSPGTSSRSQGPELEKLLAKVKPHAGDGRHERFKSTIDFDGPYHRKQHGFE